MTVESQLRDLGAHIESEQPPITVEEIQQRLGPPAQESARRARRPWLLVAAVLALLAAGLASLLAVGGGDDDPLQPVDSVPATTPTPTSITPSTSTPDTATDAEDTAPSGATQRTPIEPIGPIITPDVSGTFVGETIALDWDGIVASTSLDMLADPSLYVTESPTGYLMMDLSWRMLDEESGGPKFWRSSDGVTWAPTKPLGFETLHRDLASERTYEQIGNDHWIVGFDPPAIWRSTDTVEWVRVDVPERPRVGRADYGNLERTLYDAGGRALWIGDSGLAYWFSPDTGTWLPDPDVVDPFDSEPDVDLGAGSTRVGAKWVSLPAAVGDRVVIAGATEVSVSSQEGTTRVPAPWTADTAFVEAVGDTFVAYVGGFANKDYWFEFFSTRELMLEEVWTSTDGVNWTGPTIPDFIDGPTPALFLTNNGVGAIVTRSGLWTTRDGVAWTASGINPVLNDGNVTTVGQGALLVNFDRAWYSPDMEAWQELPLDQFQLGDQWGQGHLYSTSVADIAYLVSTVNPGSDAGFGADGNYETDVLIIRQP